MESKKSFARRHNYPVPIGPSSARGGAATPPTAKKQGLRTRAIGHEAHYAKLWFTRNDNGNPIVHFSDYDKLLVNVDEFTDWTKSPKDIAHQEWLKRIKNIGNQFKPRPFKHHRYFKTALSSAPPVSANGLKGITKFYTPANKTKNF